MTIEIQEQIVGVNRNWMKGRVVTAPENLTLKEAKSLVKAGIAKEVKK